MKFLKKNSIRIFIIALIVYFTFFIFYDLNWGAPFYFHPDERNIASSVSQLNIFSNMNPHFFAYGALPIYLIYFMGIITNFTQAPVLNPHISFESAIIIGRIISAVLTTALVFLIYKTAKKIGGTNAGYLSLVFSLTSTAFFQFSHFGTFEIWLSFFSLLLTYSLIIFSENSRIKYLILSGFIFGLVSSLKASSVVLAIVPAYVILSKVLSTKKFLQRIGMLAKFTAIFLYSSAVSYFITSPFNLIDYKSFHSSMQYEANVATGILPVFYTGSFHNTVPILFQFQKILPFLINPFLTVLIIPAFLYSLFLLIRIKDKKIIIFILSFLALFISGSILFAKWTRYVVPSVPFMYILISVFLERLFKQKFFVPSVILLSVTGIIFSFSYIKTARISLDSRLAAVKFAESQIPSNSSIASDVYDMGIVPFNSDFHNITLFNFYDLDNSPNKEFELSSLLETTNYIILPSQRIYESRILHSKQFPKGYKFYSELFSGKLGFRKIYQTPCDIFCKIAYLGNPVFNVEQTSNVFDRPTLFIFRKANEKNNK